MITTSSIWLNALISLVLCVSLSLFIARTKALGKSKFLTITSLVVLSITLVVLNGYSLYNLQKKKQSFKLIKPKIIEVKDLSSFRDNKYLVNVVVPPELNKPEIKNVVIDCTRLIEQKKRNASVIWVAVFNKHLPEEELNPAKDNPYLVALTRKVKSGYKGVLNNVDFKSAENYKGIDIFWNK